MGAGLGNDVAMLTDGRFSGGSHGTFCRSLFFFVCVSLYLGFIIGHITPEAQDGGPLALVQNGDRIKIDAETNVIDFEDVSPEELSRRRAAWTAPPLKATNGTLFKYIQCVKSASLGCVTDE